MLHCPHVLIIDDDEINNFISSKLISKIVPKVKVTNCLNGDEGIDFLNNIVNNIAELPDIIFLDLNMPVTDGWQFLERYQKTIIPYLNKTIIIYIITSSIFANDVLKSKSYSFVNKFISKPLDIEKTRELLSHW